MFWLKIARRAVGRSKGVWLKNTAKCVVEFEWQGIGRDAISLINAEIGNMLSSVAGRKVRSMLTKELEERPNLGMIKEIVPLELKLSCAILKRKRDRRMMIKLRGGVAAFQIEVGRWQGVERKKRTCKECQSGEVEDVCHWLLQCPAWDHLWQPLVEEVSQCNGFQGQSLTKQVAFVLATACTNHTLLNYLSSMWCARFGV